MTENNSQKTDNQFLIPQNYEFNLKEYFQLGWKIFKQNIGGFVGFTFLNVFILSIILLVSFLSASKFGSVRNSEIKMIGEIIVVVLGLFLGTHTLFGVLICGYLSMAHKIHREEPYSFQDFYAFSSYKEELIPLLFASFSLNLISIILSLVPLMSKFIFGEFPIYIIVFTSQIFTILSYIALFYCLITYSISPLLVMFGGLGWKEAMRISRKITHKRFLKYIVFVVILGFIANLGLIGLYFGVFVTFPLAICIFYAAYAQIFGVESKILEKMIAEIGEDKRE